MVDLWYNAPPPPPLASFNPDAAVLTIGSAGKSFWGDCVSAGSAPARTIASLIQARDSLDLGTPLLEQLALLLATGKCRHTAAAAADMLKARRDMCETLMAEYFPRWRFSPPEGGLSFGWNFPDMLATCSLRVRKAGDPYRHRYAVWAGRGVRSLFTSAVYAAG